MLQTSLLGSHHTAASFDCGVPELNSFIKDRALDAGQLGICRTYVFALSDQKIFGYYTLSAWLINLKEATPGVLDGVIENFSMPAVLFGKLAIDKPNQGLGLSRVIIRDAVEKTFKAAEIIGIKAMALHAKTDRLVETYAHHGFMPCADSKKPHYLMASLPQLKAAIASNASKHT